MDNQDKEIVIKVNTQKIMEHFKKKNWNYLDMRRVFVYYHIPCRIVIAEKKNPYN